VIKNSGGASNALGGEKGTKIPCGENLQAPEASGIKTAQANRNAGVAWRFLSVFRSQPEKVIGRLENR